MGWRDAIDRVKEKASNLKERITSRIRKQPKEPVESRSSGYSNGTKRTNGNGNGTRLPKEYDASKLKPEEAVVEDVPYAKPRYGVREKVTRATDPAVFTMRKHLDPLAEWAHSGRPADKEGRRPAIGSKKDTSLLTRSGRAYKRGTRSFKSESRYMRSSFSTPSEYGMFLIGVKSPRRSARRIENSYVGWDPLLGKPLSTSGRKRKKSRKSREESYDNPWGFF